MERSARMMDLHLPILWTKMTLSMAVGEIQPWNQQGGVTAISATAQMMQFIQRTNVLCMELTILLSWAAKLHLDCFFDLSSKTDLWYWIYQNGHTQVSCEMQIWIFMSSKEKNAYDIVKQFRRVIGRSYIPPKFAFGFGQSRWGYTTKRRLPCSGKRISRESYPDRHDLHGYWLYAGHLKTSQSNEKNFPDFPEFVKEMKDQELRWSRSLMPA